MLYFCAENQSITQVMVFKRKLYDEMLRWKTEMSGQYALLIKGARRVGKSTLAEEFAKKEYDSYILIDFSVASDEITELPTTTTTTTKLISSFQKDTNSSR